MQSTKARIAISESIGTGYGACTITEELSSIAIAGFILTITTLGLGQPTHNMSIMESFNKKIREEGLYDSYKNAMIDCLGPNTEVQVVWAGNDFPEVMKSQGATIFGNMLCSFSLSYAIPLGCISRVECWRTHPDCPVIKIYIKE